jgi:hypothetical protein
MRNIAFSIVLAAIALLQIAVVSSELSPPAVKTAAAAKSQASAQFALASTQAERKASAL